MTHHFSTGDPIGDERTHELLADIEESSQAAIRHSRATAAMTTKAAVEIRAGDVCDRGKTMAHGTTRELQRHGVACVLNEPVMTGSVFYLVFDRDALDLAAELAICDRSIMLSDTAFDTHFRFVREIEFPGDEHGR